MASSHDLVFFALPLHHFQNFTVLHVTNTLFLSLSPPLFSSASGGPRFYIGLKLLNKAAGSDVILKTSDRNPNLVV